MLKRIVMWRLKDSACGCTKAENALTLKLMLEKLPAMIPEIEEFEVGINCNDTAVADVVLCSTFKDGRGLETFLGHPEHGKVVDFIKNVREERWLIDYTV